MIDEHLRPAPAPAAPDVDVPPGHSHGRSVSAILRQVLDRAEGETITIGEIIGAFGERAFGLVLILFSLPNCVPAPPGLASIIGIPVFIFGIQMALGRPRPWLPRRLREKRVALSTFRKVLDVAEPRLRWIESFCKPRYTGLFGPLGDRLIGVFAILCSLSVMVPIIGSNFPPSIALVIVSIAVMEEDGIILMTGVLIGVAGLIYTTVATAALAGVAWVALTSWFGL